MPKPSPPTPKDRPPEARAALRGRLERAAGEVNPFLVILAVGIAILDLTCYAGIAGTRQLASNAGSHAAPSVATPAMQPVSDGR